MQAALYKLSAKVSDQEVGAFWFPRLVEWMRLFEAARARIGEDRFIDIDYREVGKNPMAQAQRVLSRMGIPVDDQLEHALAEFLAGNKREQRPIHEYSLERFNLSEDEIQDRFRTYREKYTS